MSSATTFGDLAGMPPATATTKDSVLIIIDAQNGCVDANGTLAVSNIKTSRPATESLLKRYRSSNGKIIHATHTVPDGSAVFTPGTQLAEELDELKPLEGEQVIRKTFPGSFAQPELEDVVKRTGLQRVVVVGYMAHVCVSTTAREGHQKGFEMLLPEDAMGDRDIPGARRALYIGISTTEHENDMSLHVLVLMWTESPDVDTLTLSRDCRRRWRSSMPSNRAHRPR